MEVICTLYNHFTTSQYKLEYINPLRVGHPLVIFNISDFSDHYCMCISKSKKYLLPDLLISYVRMFITFYGISKVGHMLTKKEM